MSLVPRLPPHAEPSIQAFLRHHVADAHASGVAVGMSGGIDSALAARLCRDSLGADRVLGVLMPTGGSTPELERETAAYARELGIAHRVVRLDSVESAYRALLPEIDDRVTWGNTVARSRMTVLFALARNEHRLVVGTGNKSELLLGYYTKFGDGGADLLPLGDLYKTEVRALAEQLGLPEPIRRRPPTAGLWEGQTDEAELGAPYELLDQILRGLEELRDPGSIARTLGIPIERVHEVEGRIAAHRHKRRLPPIPKLGLRTVGVDWRD